MKKLFREEAVDNYKERFSVDKQVSKISFSTMFLIFLFVVVFFFFVVWFIFGNIVNTVNITGIVYPTLGIESISSQNSGIISEITVKVGDEIEAGDIVAVIPDEDALKKINTAISSNENKEIIENIRQDYQNKSVIVSKYSGKIVSTHKEGAFVTAGEAVVTVAANRKDSNQRQICAFLPTSQKNNISKGCAVQVSPNYAPREKYGYINGYVVDIGKSIITKKSIENKLDIYNIPSLFEENESYIAVYINLLSDLNAESGLAWSEKNSTNINVETGTICNASIVVSEQAPYEWILGGEKK